MGLETWGSSYISFSLLTLGSPTQASNSEIKAKLQLLPSSVFEGACRCGDENGGCGETWPLPEAVTAAFCQFSLVEALLVWAFQLQVPSGLCNTIHFQAQPSAHFLYLYR